MTKTVPLAVMAIAATLFATPTLAQEAAWVGEGSFGAGMTSGNTDTTDFGMGLKTGPGSGPLDTHR
jgi:hypothetical protein